MLKFNPLRAIADPHSTYLDCFGYLGTDGQLFQLPSFTSKYTALHEHFQDKDLAICIGGDSSLLPIMAEIDPDIDLIIKISPCLSRGQPGKEGKRDHNSFVSSMSDTLRSKIVHFGVLDYTTSQSEVNTVLQDDQAKIVYLDKFGKSNVQALAAVLANYGPTTKTAVVIDCESLTPDYFPGVPNPAVFGLEEKEIFGIMDKLGGVDLNMKMLLFANYNPTVESRRSGDVLAYLIYTYLNRSKVAGSSVLASLSENN